MDRDAAWIMLGGLTGRGTECGETPMGVEIFDKGESAQELVEITREAVKCLTPAHRKVLRMRYFHAMGEDKIAYLMEISEERVCELVTEARQQLRQKICTRLGAMAAA